MEIVMEIQLPLFKGFLEHEIFLDERLCDELHSNEEYYKEKFGNDIALDNLTFDDERYQHDVCLQAIERFRSIITSNYPNFLIAIEYSTLISPPYYQSNTDRLYVNVILCNEWRDVILNFMRTNKDWLTQKIAQDWTSRSGFTSYLHNDYEKWEYEINQVYVDSRYLSTIIGYMILAQKSDAMDYINGCMTDLEFSDYIDRITESQG